MATSSFTLLTDRPSNQRHSELTLCPTNPLFSKAKQLARFQLDGVDYIRKAVVAKPPKQKERTKISQCWRFGEVLIRSCDRKEVYYCYDCEREGKSQRLPVMNGNRPGLEHMDKAHNRSPVTGVIRPVAKKEAAPAFFDLVHKKDFEAFKLLLIQWFVFCQVAFMMLENTLFRDLVTYLNTSIGALLPSGRSLLRQWIMAEYHKQKVLLKAELHNSQSKIHLAFDIWTAGNWYSVISVWGYWIDSSGQRQRRLLAFRRIFGSHDGENQAEVLLEVIAEFDLATSVGYFVADNHPANDSAVTLVLKQLFPRIATVDVVGRRLRCFGHIINLAAQSMLAASDAEKKKAKDELGIDDGAWKKASKEWLAKGPLGKLHRLVKYVLGSSQRREEFGGIKGGRKVVEFDHLGVS
jgi:hypothetical protein